MSIRSCLSAVFALGEVGAFRQQRLLPIARHLAQLAVDAALPRLVAGAVVQQDGVAVGEALLVGLADRGRVALEPGRTTSKPCCLQNLRSCTLALRSFSSQMK